MDKRVGFALAWIIAATVAIAIGVAAVTTVGASIRGRGPLGSEVELPDTAEGSASPDPKAPKVRDVVEGDWGKFVVECRGAIAYGIEAQPNKATGWRTVSYEPGPDDDVDAVFSSRQNSVDLEVYCNQGKPVAEIENNTLPDDDD